MARILDVVEVPDFDDREMVRRVPEKGAGDFRIGTQLIVREQQSAVFFRDGKALDTFGPGRHAVSTANIPLLVNIIAAAFSGETPFKAEVYFVNMREFVDQKWGTPEAVAIRDGDLGMVRLRAFGTYSTQVKDPHLFVNKIVGTQGLYDTGDIENFLRTIIVSRFTDLLGETKASLFDLPSLYEEFGAAVKAKSSDEFEALALDLKTLYVANISPTEDTQKAIDERAAMGAIGNMQAYLQFKAARALERAAEAGGEGGGAGDFVGAGLGLGAGAGLGLTMAQLMSQALQAGATPAAEPAGPMGREEMQRVLDNLDARFAEGAISEETYQGMRARWEERLAKVG